MKRILLGSLFTLLLLWLLLSAVVYAAMRRTPLEFSRLMMRLPAPLLMAIPFPPMWKHARAGWLAVGDPAPGFLLKTRDGAAAVALSSFRGRKPVVLVFGSYT